MTPVFLSISRVHSTHICPRRCPHLHKRQIRFHHLLFRCSMLKMNVVALMRCVCCVGENKRGKLVGERKNECRLHEALVHFTYMRLPRSGLANLCHSPHRPHDMLCMYTGMTCTMLFQ